MNAIDAAAWEAIRMDSARIEERLLAGENRVEVLQPSGAFVVYEVPRWRRHPIRRARVALARARSRSSS